MWPSIFLGASELTLHQFDFPSFDEAQFCAGTLEELTARISPKKSATPHESGLTQV
jgi:hypothetical protein